MSDWKGIAMVIQQLGKMAEPSQLDLLEREYELQSVEKEADRQHEFLKSRFDHKSEQYETAVKEYKDLLNDSGEINAMLPDKLKNPLDYSGNTDKIFNDVFGKMYTNYETGIEQYSEELNTLQDEIVRMQTVNTEANIAKEFSDKFHFPDTDVNYQKESQLDEFAEMNLNEKYKAIEIGADDRYGTDEEINQLDEAVRVQRQELKDVFKLVARGEIDVEEEATEVEAKIEEKQKDILAMTPEEKLEWEMTKSRVKYQATSQHKIDDAKVAIPKLIGALQAKKEFINDDGDIDFATLEQLYTNHPTYSEYKKHMAVLAKSGEAYLFRPPQLTKNTFHGIYDHPAVGEGYNYDSYQLVTSGYDTEENEVDRIRYKWVQREYEWLINNWERDDNARTFDPRNGKEVSVKYRRDSAKKMLEFMYGIGK